MKHQITLFVGDTHESLSAVAKARDSTAFLINYVNYKDFLISEPNTDVTIYTSLGDLPKDPEVFINIAMASTKIVYAPPVTWSDNKHIDPVDPTSCVQGLTENLLLRISNYRPIENLEKCYFYPRANPLVDTRKTKKTQLWVAG
jgi:hypothetical protein